MKKICSFLIYFICCTFNSSFGQGNTWTWISGDSAANPPEVGVIGVPSVNSHPPNIYEGLKWKDKQGNFWLYGGFSLKNDTIQYNNTDLWEFNPLNMQWTWVKGSGYPGQPLHGSKGVANAANTPGARTYAAPSWVDTVGNLWLCGGAGYGDDMWKYSISANEWTWVSGDTTANKPSFHGTLGVAGAQTTPGNRYSTTSAWTDSANNLWLFGGFGFDDDTMGGGFNDLMKYNIASGEWTWVNGSALRNPDGLYGTQGISNASNEPVGRFPYTNWMDIYGNFWIFGGFAWTNSDFASLNDVWKYDLAANEWTWMSGSDTLSSPGNYHASCSFDSINAPFSRFDQASSVTDSCGKFWLFGGSSGDPFVPLPLNDLWVFDPQLVQWNLVRGTGPSGQQPASYGAKGVSSILNMPPAREGALAWWGNDNKFYLFGGQGATAVYADLWVFDPDTSCVPSCNAVNIPPPVADFKSDSTELCANSCIGFTDLSTNATSWKWSFAGGIPLTSTDQNPQNICYQAGGLYSVTLIASNAGGQDSIRFSNYINVVPDPPTPVIKQINDSMLYCSSNPLYASYQWYGDSVLIPGATDTLLHLSTSGSYEVEVKNAAGCGIATGTYVTITGIIYFQNENISVFPNPAGNKLTVCSQQLTGEKATIELYNVLGEMVYSQLPTANCQLPTEIDISSLSPGIYFLHLQTENRSVMMKFVKE